MTISTRAAQLAAYRTSEAQITALFAALIERITGILVREAGADGTIPLQRIEAVRQIVRETVESYFVRRVPVTGITAQREDEHLNNLLAVAREELNASSQRQRSRLLGRLTQLSRRYGLMTGGIALWAFDTSGQPQTEYARIIYDATASVTRAAVITHADMMREALVLDAPVIRAMQLAQPTRAASQYGAVLTWPDSRGYALSDRIWNVSEATAARLDALVRDGIQQGRSAVDLARDLERYLSPSRRMVKTLKPYGTQGSFDARRLARTEITRAHALATREAGLANPFVTRARYHLSRSHSPANCDGTCDDHYAADQAQGGFEPGSEPIPVVDTHPQCLCFVTHETGELELVLPTLRMPEQIASAPFTPLATTAFVAWLMGHRTEHVTPTATAEEF